MMTAQPPEGEGQERIPELDGLRGVAISLVLIFHYFTAAAIFIRRPNPIAYLQIATRLSWSGVDLFFVLSGFLIGGILLNARQSKNFFKVFYLRRACRILPVYLLFLAFVAMCNRFVYPSNYVGMKWVFGSTYPWYSYLTFTQNLWEAYLNYAGSAALVITWSLAVEEQFYLTLPFVIRFISPSKLPYIIISGILAAPAVRLYLLLSRPALHTAEHVLLPCRMDTLLLGVLVAYLRREMAVWSFFVRHRKGLWALFTILGLGLIYFTSSSSGYSFPMASVGFDWLALFYATALVLVLVDRQSWLGCAMRWRWLMGLGAVAYGAYLFHFVVYGLCMAYLRGHGHSLQNLPDLGVTLLSLGLVIGLAKLSWRFIEKPIVRWGHTARY
jgi:peptidoglycan/LPS O-acetylase OafA/YrhL